ncbi:MAG: sugar ABC transporter substrate-binding protein [Lachnospiraceae bacterium]|jgi:ribose transport system substrate-binding protein|nr:sugar ABC transporter substrate-binding protein [Lachnospiraceae bacterium]
MKKSRLFALILAMVLVVSSLAACGGSDDKDTTAAPADTTAAAAETDAPEEDTTAASADTTEAAGTEAAAETKAAEPGTAFVDQAKMELKADLIDVGHDVKIALIVKQRSELFYASIESGFLNAVEEAQAMVDYNIEAQVLDDNTDLAKELENVQYTIDNGFDIVVFVAMDPKSSVPAFDLLVASDVKTLIVDAPCDGSEKCDAVIVSANEEAGRMQMEKLCEQLGGKGNVLILTDSTNPNAAIREQGAMAELENWPDVKIIAEGEGDIPNVNVDKAQQKMNELYQVYGSEINGIWTFSDTPAQGAIAALQESQSEGIVVTGIDGNAVAKQLIQGGQMYGTAAQFPNALGYDGVVAGLEILAGTYDQEQTIYVPVQWIDSSNVDEYAAFDQ